MTPIKILDGGLGTTLETHYSYKFSSSTPLWSSHLLLTHPDRQTILACHKEFVSSGAQVVSTATYQVSFEGFAATKTEEWPHGVPPEYIPQFITSAINLASSAAGTTNEISLALGPLGATILPNSAEYTGSYPPQYSSVDQIQEWHYKRLVQLFLSCTEIEKVSYLAFETIPRLDEIIAIRKVMQRIDGGKRFWITVNFPGKGYRLPDGSGVKEIVEGMLDEEKGAEIPWGIGINCTKVSKLSVLVKMFEQEVRKVVGDDAGEWPSLVLYPDGTKGEVYNVQTKEWELPDGEKGDNGNKLSWEDQIVEVVRETRERGRWREILVGGCCRCLPEDIGRLRGLLLGYNEKGGG
ncbi:homocysteine S-methyltransferase [Podospora fimiseda]|uniref:Homocysteine S-methyltransferase n=1 Tax=Podospora fimiseda TaxID=252190 RepID=A0AAN7BP01_9PEZI|nr:homocysteine S-methyltransferase [Podospora fimiseda]